MFDTLGACTDGEHFAAAAILALLWGGSLRAAVMAVQLMTLLVVGHVCITAMATGGPAAVMAHQQGGETSAVDKEQYLSLLLDV